MYCKQIQKKKLVELFTCFQTDIFRHKDLFTLIHFHILASPKTCQSRKYISRLVKNILILYCYVLVLDYVPVLWCSFALKRYETFVYLIQTCLWRHFCSILHFSLHFQSECSESGAIKACSVLSR